MAGAPAARARPANRARPRTSLISASTSGAGGLETSTTSSTPASASSRRSASRVASPPTSADRSRPPTPSAWVTPTPTWSSSASTCWQPVPEAATRPTGPGWTTLAKPRPRPPTTAVPQSGPVTSSLLLSGGPLERDLLLDRHVVAEDHHVVARLDGVHRLDEGVRAGHRDQRDRVGPATTAARRNAAPWSAAAPPRWARSRGGWTRVERPLHARPGPSSREPPSASRTATTMSLGVASAGTSKPISVSTSTLSAVAIATWAAAHARRRPGRPGSPGGA